MFNSSYDFKTNITILATYWPILGLILTFLLAQRYSGTIKWSILSLGPAVLLAITYLVWGLWASKVVLKSVTDPFYICGLLLLFYLVGHSTYLFLRLIMHLLKKRKKSHS